jgi:hypothetical protein
MMDKLPRNIKNKQPQQRSMREIVALEAVNWTGIRQGNQWEDGNGDILSWVYMRTM